MTRHPADDMTYAEVMARMKPIHDQEEADVRALGERIGYGRVMQLCEQIWTSTDVRGAISRGPCVGLLVPCGCSNGCCDWCEGSGRVTKRVRAAQRQAKRP
jgi:hypothetical protein